jgi:glyoxylase-like metal-dependent hydrolase (beta-lactamase superfamily II)
VIVISPDKKQLHTLGWPNDIINSIALKTSKGIVLIDTQNSPANAQLIKKAAIEEFADTTFVYIINTHGHSCHSGGNCIFDENTIVAQSNSMGEIEDYDNLFLGQTVEFLRKKIYNKTNILDTITVKGALSDSLHEAIDLYQFYEADLINNYRARYPDITFNDTLTLSANNKTIQLSYMGKGHGDADILVYLKEDKVLCTGNLFHLGSYDEEEMPSFYLNRENEIDKWIKTLSEVLEENEDIRYVISTHGKKPFKRSNIEFINDYCKAVRSKVKEAKANHQDIETVQDIEAFKPLFDQYRNVLNISSKVKEMHARNIGIIWKYIE